MIRELKKEMPYKWRVQSCNSKVANCVAYVDSRDVMDRLDEVVGFDKWQDEYKQVKNNLYCGIGILIGDEWVWKWDCGVESNIEKAKGEASDAFKRAAVKWGVGRFLYDMPIHQLWSVKEAYNSTPNKKRYVPINPVTKKEFYGNDLTIYLNSLGNNKQVPPRPQPSPSPSLQTFSMSPSIESAILKYKEDGYSVTQILGKLSLKYKTDDNVKEQVVKVYEGK